MAGVDLTWSHCTVRLGDLRQWERNPRKISKRQAKRLLHSWQELGQFQTIAIGPGNEVYDGHQRLSVLLQAYGPDYRVQALRASRPLSDDERKQLALQANISAGVWDWSALEQWGTDLLQREEAFQSFAEQVANMQHLLDVQKQAKNLDKLAQASDKFVGGDDSLFQLRSDVIFESSLPYGFPGLREDRLLRLDDSVQVWIGDNDDGHSVYWWVWDSEPVRNLPPERMVICFYTDDYRFERVFANPAKHATKFLNAGIGGLVMPNFSMYWDMPQIMRLWNRYRSLWLARYMQEAGILVMPEVQLSVQDGELCWVGIPSGADVATQFHTKMSTGVLAAKLNFLQEVVGHIQPRRLFVYVDKQYVDAIRRTNLETDVVFVLSRLALKRNKMEVRGG